MRLLLQLLLLLSTACSSFTSDIRVQSRKLADIDFRAQRVYEWSDSTAIVVDTTATWTGSSGDLDTMLREAVDRELQAAGLTRVTSGGLLRVDLTAVGTRTQATEPQVREGAADDEPIVTEGSLLVKISHVPTGALVWRGVARSTANRIYAPQDARKRIDYAIHEMFEDFGR